MNNLGRSESSIDRIVNFCKKNATYMSRGFLTAALVVALAVTVTGCKGGDDQKSKKPQTEQDGQQSDDKNAGDGEDKSEDQAEDSQSADAKIQELFSTYYNSYAAGDVDKLSNVTKYLSDMEKDYIQMMHKNVDSYDNVSCTVEEGNKKGSYMVSVVYDMKFSGAKEALPGLNVFYVQTDKEGQLYINNRYSSFNRELKEQKMNKKILKLIKEFEGGDKIQTLNDEVQDKYDKIIEDDNKLKKKVAKVAKAITKWKDSYVAKAEEEEPKNKEPKNEEQPEESTQQETPEDNQPEQTPEEPQQDENSNDNASDDSSSDEGESGGINYVPEGTVLTANNVYNVRTSMSVTSEIMGSTAVGDSIKVVLSYAEGWTKVEWNGKTGYIRTDLLLQN